MNSKMDDLNVMFTDIFDIGNSDIVMDISRHTPSSAAASGVADSVNPGIVRNIIKLLLTTA